MEAHQKKKSLGQHFLRDKNIAKKIATLVSVPLSNQEVVEIGPGAGALTHWLVQRGLPLYLIEVDPVLVRNLQETYPTLNGRVLAADFLTVSLERLSIPSIILVGNFPYNISSQIFFKVLAYKHLVSEVVCMIQKEVALRIAAAPGSKTYGILSVLLQAFYDIQYCFTVPAQVFSPPPKVQSAVIKLVRNKVVHLPCDESLFFRIVKAGFQQRRKVLRNALKPIGLPLPLYDSPILALRAEQLSVADFISLAQAWKKIE